MDAVLKRGASVELRITKTWAAKAGLRKSLENSRDKTGPSSHMLVKQMQGVSRAYV